MHDGITTHSGGEQEFGFSIYEDASSAAAAFTDMIGEIFNTDAVLTDVVIQRVPGHLDRPITDLVGMLQAQNIRVTELTSREPRTSIRVAMRE